MMTILKRSLFVFLLTMGLASCANMAPPAPSVHINTDTRQASLNQIKHWQISGKIAVQTSKDSGSATVNWLQNQKSFQLTLMGPLGTNSLKLSGSDHQVTLETANGKTFSAATPEQLLAKQWGFNVPVSYLHYWIRGLPVPNVPADSQFDTYGRLSTLKQEDWQVLFLAYTRVASIDLPAKIAITSAALKVKIIVYQWKI